MKKGLLINDLELGYAPMSAFTFKQIIKDKKFQEYVLDNHIYIICQKRELTFNNFNFSSDRKVMEFEICQEKNSEKLICKLPIFQKNLATDLSKNIVLGIQNRRNTIDENNSLNLNGTQGIIFQELELETNNRKNINWFSPEKLLQNYWKGLVELEIIGNYRKLLEYRVHYVGKSTEQNICQRLSNHSTFQEILINEDSLCYGNIPSNEISILLFRIKDNTTIAKWGQESNGDDITDYLLNYYLPDDKTLSLDAEKALIKHLQPEYNRIMYNSYPTDKDLINKDIHNAIFYGIEDPITLIYKNGQLKGGEWSNEKDFIIIEKEN